MSELRRTVLPLMLLGDGQVGKTSMISRLTGNQFTDSQLTTVGKESYIHQVKKNNYELKMKIWDTAGQERFKCMSVQVIKNSDAVILVYAVNNKKSFQALDVWMNKLSEVADIRKIPIIIVGNKADVPGEEREVTYEEGNEYAISKNYKFFETSAKTGQNIKEAFMEIFDQLFELYHDEITGEKSIEQRTKLNNKDTRKNKKCCKQQ